MTTTIDAAQWAELLEVLGQIRVCAEIVAMAVCIRLGQENWHNFMRSKKESNFL